MSDIKKMDKGYLSQAVYSTFENIADNWQNMYSGVIGLASATPMPYIGQLNPYVAAIMLTTPSVVSMQEDYNPDNSTIRTHHNHEIMCDSLMNFGTFMLSHYLLPKLNTYDTPSSDHKPVILNNIALPVLSAIITSTVVFAGDNSPLDNIEKGMISSLDYILGDWI